MQDHEPEYLRINRANWDDRAMLHATSEDYGLAAFDDPEHLSAVIGLDLDRLGDLAGKRVVHLQCHIGADTVSLARLGGSVVGVDLSPESIRQARLLDDRARRAKPETPACDWVVSDVYAAPQAITAALGDDHGPGEFDLVYTGAGALCWLPDICRWAEVVANLLKPGGRLLLREAHPVLWALDDPRPDQLLALEFPYFEEIEPITWDSDQTYVHTDRPLAATTSQQWNHGLGEIINALLLAGLRLTMIEEYDRVMYAALGSQMEETGDGQFRLGDRPARLPASYLLEAIKINGPVDR